ncbi:MAG: hypothetical protein HY738_13450 [Bacteroidia bacterium]|nr:hypothetical protein [Bacteroidia bacterium]
MRKIKNILYWIFATGYLIVALSLISGERERTLYNSVDIIIADKTKHRFVEKQDILNIFSEHGIQIVNRPVESINLDRLEQLLKKHPSIKKAEVYIASYGVLRIEIEQRNPVVRVFHRFGGGYYIDEDGLIMDLSKKYTAHVLVVNGYINEPFAKMSGKNVAQLRDIKNQYLLDDIYYLAKYIYDNKFWKAMIEQIYINENYEIEIISKIGKQIILLGTSENFENKLANLMLLYKRGLNKVGWDTYKTINLKYQDQIVCTKN